VSAVRRLVLLASAAVLTATGLAWAHQVAMWQ
jgi:hypothetical protein